MESALAAVISSLDGDYFTELGVEQGEMTVMAQEHEEKLTKGKEKLEVMEKVITLHQGEDGKKKKKKKGKAKEELDGDFVEQVDTSSQVLMFACQDAEELNIHTPDELWATVILRKCKESLDCKEWPSLPHCFETKTVWNKQDGDSSKYEFTVERVAKAAPADDKELIIYKFQEEVSEHIRLYSFTILLASARGCMCVLFCVFRLFLM